MKVGVFLGDLNPQEGGGFTFYDRLIKAIDDYEFNPEIDVIFIGKSETQSRLLRKELLVVKSGRWIPRCVAILSILRKSAAVFNSLFILLEKKLNRQYTTKLKQYGVDLLFYPIQASNPIKNYPFISTNWDIAHLTTYPFPEFVDGKEFDGREFEGRERWYHNQLKKSLLIFAESEAGKEEIHTFLNIAKKKIEVVPLFPGNLVNMVVNEREQRDLLLKNELVVEAYFFYPAQFWAHKNHYNLLLAFNKLMHRKEFRHIKLVLTGSDKGNKAHILRLIKDYQLNNVTIMGFVTEEVMYTLYQNALAVVMPSFLGPTNMPLIEAQHLDTPVICSDFKGHRELLGDAALYFEPEEADSIYAAMKDMLNPEIRSDLLIKSKEGFLKSEFTLETALSRLEQGFLKSKRVRQCWQ